MAIKAWNTGSLAMTEIAAEFGGTAPHALSEYYSGGSLVGAGTTGTPGGVTTTIPSAGTVSIANFYGASNVISIDMIAVGGGGGGAASDGGGAGESGGGGGGVVRASGLTTTGGTFTIVIGAGGGSGSIGGTTTVTKGGITIEAAGGGAGDNGSSSSSGTILLSSWSVQNAFGQFQSPAPGQSGGVNQAPKDWAGVSGAGGGGAGGSGGTWGGPKYTAWTGEPGGDGFTWIDGNTYAGGGGGEGSTSGAPQPGGAGGSGGGGAGADSSGGTAVNGTNGFGGGGGGGGAGGSGGSGVVIFSYISATQTATGGNNIYQSGGRWYHVFTSSGTYVP